MKKLALVLILLCSLPCWATWALVQNATNASCTNASNTCNVTVSATGGGNVLIVTMGIASNSQLITGVSDGSSTFSLCPSSECHGTDSTNRGVDAAYTLSSTAGKTTITVTRTSSTSLAWRCRVLEYSFTNGPAVYDKGGNRDQNTTSTSPAGVTLTLTGTNDVIVQQIMGSSPTAISGSYTQPATFAANFGWGGWINTSSGTAPTWTQTLSVAALGAIAIKESSSACTPTMTLMGVERC